jgi:hypothetical protein
MTMNVKRLALANLRNPISYDGSRVFLDDALAAPVPLCAGSQHRVVPVQWIPRGMEPSTDLIHWMGRWRETIESWCVCSTLPDPGDLVATEAEYRDGYDHCAKSETKLWRVVRVKFVRWRPVVCIYGESRSAHDDPEKLSRSALWGLYLLGQFVHVTFFDDDYEGIYQARTLLL